jgi:cell division protein FtsA
VLTDAERDVGVALLDIGGGTTDLAVFMDGALVYASVLPVGGNQVSNDIAVGIRAPLPVAEEIKTRYGFALPDRLEEDRMIDVAAYDESGEGHPVSRREVSQIIEARMEETFELAYEQIARAGFETLPAGVVLCGGTAQLGGVRPLAAEIFRAPIRIGTPTGLYGLVDNISSPAFAASVGLLKWGVEQAYEQEPARGRSPLAGIGGTLAGWLRNFFP